MSTTKINNLTLRGFKASSDVGACEIYAQEQVNILKHYGITKITSVNEDWIGDPNVYVLMIESRDTGEAYAGARIHLSNKKLKLPIETAIEPFDNSIIDYINNYSCGDVAEICGLWNARKASGMGLATVFIMRAGIAMAANIGIKNLMALCAPHTLQICIDKGFKVEESMGNKGTFFYPNENLIATTLYLKDLFELGSANSNEREIITELRENPECYRKEIVLDKQPIDLYYDIRIDI